MKIQKRGLHTFFIHNGVEVARALGQEGCKDTLVQESEGVFRWTRTCPPTERMVMEVRTAYRPEFTMVPGVNYNGNGWGTFCEYQGDRYKGEPWCYGWHRVSVAAMTCSQGHLANAVWSVSMFGKENDKNSCSLFEEEKIAVHRICWPEEETPHTLRQYRYGAPYYGKITAREDFMVWIVLAEDEPMNFGYQRSLDAAWALNDHPRPQPLTPEEAWDRGIAYAKFLYTEENDGFCGFNIGLAWENNQWQKRHSNKYEIGWCGQNAMLANALLYTALQNGDSDSKKKGFAVLDSWLEYAHLPIGTVHSYYDPGQVRYLEACNQGTAGMAYFEAYDLSQALGEPHEAYKKAALEICDFAISKQRTDGCFAKCWNEDGTVAIAEGTVGSFLALPLLEAYRRTKDTVYLNAAEKSLRFYMHELQTQGFTTAGALDIFSIDKESCIPLLRGSMLLHEITGKDEWLKAAEQAAWYLSTWQYSHTMQFGEEDILTQMGYDTHGGTLVSTVHQGIDPFALCYVTELYELFLKTGEERWKSRARAIWRCGCQQVSDGTLVVDGKLRPKGSQDESCQSTRQGHMGSPSQWLVAWPGSFRMETLRRMRDLPGANEFFRE